mmetsp:Transcript_14361/g.21494  ORF Transcript_14361/g.21494 Transcript_14361/m.21494 type:complete len:223 (-) Transcript_14361:406-1074(-)
MLTFFDRSVHWHSSLDCHRQRILEQFKVKCVRVWKVVRAYTILPLYSVVVGGRLELALFVCHLAGVASRARVSSIVTIVAHVIVVDGTSQVVVWYIFVECWASGKNKRGFTISNSDASTQVRFGRLLSFRNLHLVVFVLGVDPVMGVFVGHFSPMDWERESSQILNVWLYKINTDRVRGVKRFPVVVHITVVERYLDCNKVSTIISKCSGVIEWNIVAEVTR